MDKKLSVFFDGSCPLCSREISLYRDSKSDVEIDWVDVSDSTCTLDTKDQMMKRFHVRDIDGTLIQGASAFIALWKTMPGWRHLARVSDNNVVLPIANFLYEKFLKVRPIIKEVINDYEMKIDMPKDIVRDLRSDYAGEVGAVNIYKGILATTKDEKLIEFSKHHLETEEKHLEMVSRYLPKYRRTILKPFWVAAGFLTGYLPALVSPNATYKTINAVETFVDFHYQEQIDKLIKLNDRSLDGLLKDLKSAQDDECNHRDEAGILFNQNSSIMLSIWCSMVSLGSKTAVKIARFI